MSTSYPWLTWRTVYRQTEMIVTLRRNDGTVQYVWTVHEDSLTDLMTDDQKTELAKQCREEMENET